MGSELEIRHHEKECLLQILIAQHESSNPKELKKLLLWAKAKMEPEGTKKAAPMGKSKNGTRRCKISSA